LANGVQRQYPAEKLALLINQETSLVVLIKPLYENAAGQKIEDTG